MFSVTLSVNVRFRECCPRILRGMLPYGVRTFLQQALRLTSDHLPSTRSLTQRPVKKTATHKGRAGSRLINGHFLADSYEEFLPNESEKISSRLVESDRTLRQLAAESSSSA